MPSELIQGEVRALKARGITEETCAKFGYRVGKDKHGAPVQAAPYYDGQELVAQKLRYANKDFKFIGEPKRASLFGQQLWRDGGKMVVVTEGEIDCMTVAQLQGLKWPVVSIQNGAQSARKALSQQLEWLEQFETIVLMFDMDEAGQKAVEEAASVFSPGKCKVARLPLKDPNEMLLAGRGSEVIDAIWGAKAYRPDGILSIGDLRSRLNKPVEMGLTWPWQSLTDATYGIRLHEIYTLGAGTGMGKSEVWKEVMTHLAFHHGMQVGGVFLEETPEHTVRCLAGKMDSRRYHVPDGGWTDAEFEDAITRLDRADHIFLYDHFGYTDYDIIKSRIRYMAVTLGCQYIVLDHITALVSGDRDGDERKQLDFIMTDLASLMRELPCSLFLISHLTTADGVPHEEGGRVQLKHFRGSRAIGQWSNFVFGLERNQQEEDEAKRHTSTFRILKDRYTGQATGKTFHLRYDQETGRLLEADNPFTNGECPFPSEKQDF